ncbi:MAG: ABC transporter permease [Chloroflexi bacterium]|nr:ABC transporter permease [Chloroflexota bacterium]MCI0578142.1 ABC transporter permease [Chloroflexota bacterium]MCI0649864.1 ABC transporter permease [Chloroflexota bacterium]MCI0730274.1 ABC transporter permease [Chloroflexota bacterium]
MILKYVWKSFSRRKVRTVLMILSLLVSMGLIITMSATVETIRRSNVDLIASEVGRYDLTIAKKDTSSDPFIDIAEIAPLVLAADERITAVYPRLQSEVEFNIGAEVAQGWLLALDPAVDHIGFIDVVSGTYTLGNNQAAVLADTATTYGLQVGDAIDVAYSFPLPREEGQPDPAGTSQRRAVQRFTISAIVRQDGVTSGDVREGVIIHLADAQAWLQLPGRAQRLLVTVNPALYETNNAEIAALRMRDIARAVQAALGDDYHFTVDKAAALDQAAEAFLAIQALINVYGLTALGVVGLLVHTLVMTNVQEQRRDMAILRILGSQRSYLFRIVIAEILVIGAIGISLGIVLGQALTQYVVVPLIENELQRSGITPTLAPQVTLTAILPPVISGFAVLIFSTLKPAQEASRTRVMYAINPSVADNIQLEDLARLRERRPDGKLFLAGFILLLIFGLIAGFQIVGAFGSPTLQVIFILTALGVLILGVGFLFFITTVPFERLVLLATGLVAPRLTYFARRNVGRGQLRNTLISLLVLFSGVLPSFLATQVALERANLEGTVRLRWGAPVGIEVFGWWLPEEEAAQYRLSPTFLTEELPTVPGISRAAGFSYQYPSSAADTIGLRMANVSVVGIDGRLGDVLFLDLVEFVAGGPEALDAMLADPNAVIIGEGLAEHLAVSLGSVVRLQGEGRDHVVNARVVAIARRIPGVDGIGRSRSQARDGSTVLMSLDGFRALKTRPDLPLPPADDPVLIRVLATTTPGAVAQDVLDELVERYANRERFWVSLMEVDLEESERQQATQQIFLVVLTMISFTTAVFGVFAVIYVTIYARRIEIGMLKAMGMRRRELTGMLVVEAITMTLGAALAGIAAGATMGYISTYGNYALQERPLQLAVDTTVMPFIVVMVVLASVIGAAFSARRIVRRRAVEILRMQ